MLIRIDLISQSIPHTNFGKIATRDIMKRMLTLLDRHKANIIVFIGNDIRLNTAYYFLPQDKY